MRRRFPPDTVGELKNAGQMVCRAKSRWSAVSEISAIPSTKRNGPRSLTTFSVIGSRSWAAISLPIDARTRTSRISSSLNVREKLLGLYAFGLLAFSLSRAAAALINASDFAHRSEDAAQTASLVQAFAYTAKPFGQAAVTSRAGDAACATTATQNNMSNPITPSAHIATSLFTFMTHLSLPRAAALDWLKGTAIPSLFLQRVT